MATNNIYTGDVLFSGSTDVCQNSPIFFGFHRAESIDRDGGLGFHATRQFQ